MYTKVKVVGRIKKRRGTTQRYYASIRLAGFWLDEIGFGCGTLVRVDYDNGSFTLKASGKDIESYKNVVGEVMKGRSVLLQVHRNVKRKRYYPVIDLTGLWLEDMGFKVGSVVVARCEFEAIHVRLLELE